MTQGLAPPRVYLDDLIVFASTFEMFLEWLEHVFQHLVDADLILKSSKCLFDFDTVKYLGHIVSKAGIQSDPEKVTAIHQFQVPTNCMEVQFLGPSWVLPMIYPGLQLDSSTIEPVDI